MFYIPVKKMFEMEMPEDTDGIHFAAFKDDKLVGVVSLFQKDTDFQFRKLAVATSVQNMGIGSSLLNYITNYAIQNGGTRIWCNARDTATGFYQKAGYHFTGEAFVKNDINYQIWEKALIPDAIN